MVKRNMRTARRQVLQLNDPVQQNTFNPQTGRMSAVVQYSDSESDSEDKEIADSGEQPQDQAVPQVNKDAVNDVIDVQVQDFLREINMLKGSQDDSTADSQKLTEPIITGDGQFGHQSLDVQLQENTPVSMSWQQCYDETTGYVYYWNMHTNEVTWECPPDYSDFAETVRANELMVKNSEIHPPGVPESSSNQGIKKALKKKDKDSDDEGKIIPITSFGPESSASSSSSDDELPSNQNVVVSRKAKKKSRKLRTTLQSVRKQQNTKIAIGPRLPSFLETCQEIGPQLPGSKLSDDTRETSVTPFTEKPVLRNPTQARPLSKVLIESQNAPVSGKCDMIPKESPGNSTRPEFQNSNNAPKEGKLTLEPSCQSRASSQMPCEDAALHKPIASSCDDLVVPGDSLAVSKLKQLHLRKDTIKEEAITNSTATSEEPLDACDSPKSHSNKVHSDVVLKRADGLHDGEDSPLLSDPKIPAYYLPRHNNTESRKDDVSASDYLPVMKSSDVPTSTVRQNVSSVSGTSSTSPQKGDSGEVGSSSDEPDSTTKKDVNGSISKDGPQISQSLLTLQGYESDEEVDKVQPNSKRSYPEFPNQYLSGRVGFGFVKKQKASDSAASVTCSRLDGPSTSKGASYQYVSFVKSKEVLYLNHLNDQEHPRFEGSRKSDDGDIDIEDIEKALDMALERNKGHGLSSSAGAPRKLKIDKRDSILPVFVSSKIQDKPSTLEEKIKEMSSELIDKLKFLTGSWSSATALSWLLVQVQTRLKDWLEGALQSNYFQSRLQDAHDYLSRYEQSALQNGWTCQWDREQKHYFFTNLSTGQSQWDFPMVPKNIPPLDIHMATTSDVSKPDSTFMQSFVSSSSASQISGNKRFGDDDLVVRERSSSPSPSVPPPPPPPLPPSPPPPPPPPPPIHPPPPVPPPPSSPPPPPPDSTEEEDGEIMEVEMAIQDDTDEGESHATSTDLRTGGMVCDSAVTSRSMLHQIHNMSDSKTPMSAISSSSMDVMEPSFVIARPPQPSFMIAGPSFHQPQIPPRTPDVCLPSKERESSPQLPTVDDQSANSKLSQSSNIKLESNTSSKTAAVASASDLLAISSRKRKRPKLVTGLTLKKKDMPSLVEKWQRIKEEQREKRKDSEDGVSTTM